MSGVIGGMDSVITGITGIIASIITGIAAVIAAVIAGMTAAMIKRGSPPGPADPPPKEQFPGSSLITRGQLIQYASDLSCTPKLDATMSISPDAPLSHIREVLTRCGVGAEV